MKETMISNQWRTFIGRALLLAVGVMLVSAAVPKIHSPYSFWESIRAYQIPFPARMEFVSASYVPWLELIVGVLLVAGFARVGAALLASMLGLTFVFFQGTAIYRGLTIDCGCFGASLSGADGHEIGIRSFATALGVAVLPLVALLLRRHSDEQSHAGSVQNKSAINAAPG